MFKNKNFYKILDIIVLIILFIFWYFISNTILWKLYPLPKLENTIIEKYSILNKEDIIKDLEKEREWKIISNKSTENISTNKINNPEFNIKNNLSDYKAIKKNIINDIKEDFYSMEFKDKQYLLSDSSKSYEYGFITKEIKDNVLYLYSHNSYDFSENSWYYLFNNLKLNDILTFNNDENNQYKIIDMDEINFTKNKDKNIKLKQWADIIYFTCTPVWDDVRKVYQLKKI